MGVYDRSRAEDLTEIDRWADGFGWLAHPAESGRRASHAVCTGDGRVYLFDPIDAPGLDDRLERLGSVAGVAVLSDYHARDADRIAARHGLPVTVPDWLTRIEDRVDVDVAVERTDGPIAGFELLDVRPLYAWRETVAYRRRDDTLYVPDYLSSHEDFCVGAERVGLPTVARVRPPTELFATMDPDRIVFGHGTGVFEDAAAALADGLTGARRHIPRALVSNLPHELRSMLAAIGSR